MEKKMKSIKFKHWVSGLFGSLKETNKKEKRELIFELALFFLLGILLGITVKTEAAKKITIGFDDYKVTNVGSYYDIESMKKDMQQQAASEQSQ
jgi:hypothetical protein